MQALAAAPQAELVPDFHLGFDGSVALGAFSYYGVSLRFESELKPGGNLVLRLGYARGSALEDEGDGFDAGLASIGYRRYNDAGNLYVGFEAGLVAARRRPYVYDDFIVDYEGAEWNTRPTVLGAAGVKAGPFDLGLTFGVPVMAIGLSLGLEFSSDALPAASAQPSRPGVPRRRVQYHASR